MYAIGVGSHAKLGVVQSRWLISMRGASGGRIQSTVHAAASVLFLSSIKDKRLPQSGRNISGSAEVECASAHPVETASEPLSRIVGFSGYPLGAITALTERHAARCGK